ncbi:cyclin-dependent protein kinase inhibitor SMR6-like [Impatiens glandulifera]|uniref:cyclin-dependent protein kinase inhibitor SMR6-like n=1 Tax=Impatiens glandulifera TaxID=253017 RepID=UPI001FB09A69|nr:cyclin-dependent protein kinase inhibitor SMR6-like [Impatiens glandulifera]
MGFSKKHQGIDLEGKKWVIAGKSIETPPPAAAPLKRITTKSKVRDCKKDDEYDSGSTTPTAKESRIPERLACPPAPMKRRPTARCHYNNNNGAREFFTPPDCLESVFMRHVEKAN